jgi:hypothetical protein
MSNETSWERRGHIRRPNIIVRGIYAVGDWLGDFGHLATTTKRGAGHVSTFAGYSSLLIVTLFITIFLVVTSALHSLELLHWIGFTDWTAYPTLFVVEAIFLTGSIQLDLAFKHGKYFPIPPILGFTVGLAFVLFSNVTGLADNIGGLVFGIATPFLLIISKAMLAWQYTFKAKIAKDSRAEDQPAAAEIIVEDSEEKPDEIVEENPVQQSIEPITLQDEKTDEIITENSPDKTIEKTDTVEQAEPAEENETKTEELEDEITTEIAAENTEKNEPEKADEISPEKPEEKKPDKPKRTKRSGGKKRGRKSSKKTAVNFDNVLAVAEQLKNDEKIDASQLEKEIAEQANCSKYYAKKALAELEQKADETEEKTERKFALVEGGRN